LSYALNALNALNEGHPVDNVKITTCATCGQTILAGRIVGLRTRLAPYALTLRGEKTALHDGQPVFNITPAGCWPRTRDDRREGATRPTVLAFHQHDSRPPDDIDLPATRALLERFLDTANAHPTGPPPY
jgi:hypothetical protein